MLDVLNDPNDDRITVAPDEFFFQVDGASDNRTIVFFVYCELLGWYGIVELVKMTYLIVGHTHNDADQQFAPITHQLRTAVVVTMDDPIAQYYAAYGDQKPLKVEPVTVVPDYREWLVDSGVSAPFEGMSLRVPDENRPHQYVWSSTAEGMEMWYKNLAVDDTPWNKEGKCAIRCTGMRILYSGRRAILLQKRSGQLLRNAFGLAPIRYSGRRSYTGTERDILLITSTDGQQTLNSRHGSWSEMTLIPQ